MAHDWSKTAGGFKSSVPGSLMLFGEHAVLNNRCALVTAIDRRIYAHLIPNANNNNQIIINSNLGCYETTLQALKAMDDFNALRDKATKPLKFVLAAIQAKADHLKTGFNLTISSDFSHTLGFGSSAAVVVAVLAVISQHLSQEEAKNNHALFMTAKKVIQTVQGTGSGADVAASVFGGVVYYCPEPLMIQSIKILPPLTTVYSGYKTPTPEVIRKLKTAFEHKTEALETLYDQIHLCTQEAKLALEDEDWHSLGQKMNMAQTWMRELKVSDDILEQKISALLADPNILGAKISGAGLGDCVIGLGKTTQKIEGVQEVNASLQGVCYHAA